MTTEEVELKCKELLNLESSYFGNDKMDKIKQLIKDLKTKIKIAQNLKKSQTLYVQGVINSIGEEYKKESEQFLTKSLKIDPQNITGWNLLGETFIKKKDYNQAESCFNFAIKIVKKSQKKTKLSIRKKTPNLFVN